jgi:hypothetical protein
MYNKHEHELLDIAKALDDKLDNEGFFLKLSIRLIESKEDEAGKKTV